MIKFLRKIYGIVFLTACLLLCCATPKQELVKIDGEAQGTTYHISYIDPQQHNYKAQVDSILKDIDRSLSTWDTNSIISRINRNENSVVVDKYFKEVFKQAMEVSRLTEGGFDITVAPLVNAYGFGSSKKLQLDSNIIDSLKALVGYSTLSIQDDTFVKANPNTQIDFNAIAQGYSVDVLCAFFDSKHINNYLVELGGELKAKGSKYDSLWKVGIDKPIENESGGRKIEAIVTLKDKALCTSGNYRKYYVQDGKRYAHIIDPKTGLPAKQNILSSTVVAKDASTADAYATAFMVMGLEASKRFLQLHPELGLEVYFIYDDNGSWKTFASKGIEAAIKELR
jgi:thiamine biosynthesis lipoprotein